MTRIILFLLKCLVGLLATVGFLLVAAVVAAALLIPRFEGLMPQLAAVPEQAVLVPDLSEGVIERSPASPPARAPPGGTMVLREEVEALDAAGAADSRKWSAKRPVGKTGVSQSRRRG